ncbi:hypothetical protein RRF57_001913 [Xylaria bambusicola]|uniref:DUF7820 domain-containing protein n=1 Tax=Xylaria bambusicola TaxID=326684 RepID=A0AAN7Z404_9PEZI
MSQLVISIRRKLSSTDVTAYALDLTYNHSYTTDSYIYSYGVQPPSLTDQQLELVNDTFEPSRGPAWALALPYEKTVLLPEQFLTYSSSDKNEDEVQRRTVFGFDFKRKGLAHSGEKPWICTWPSTILEILIYPYQNNTYTFPIPSSSTGNQSSGPMPTESSSDQTTRKRRGAEKLTMDYDTRSDEDDWRTHLEEHSNGWSSMSTTPPTSSASSTSSTTSATSSAEPNYFSSPPMIPPPYPPYPKIIKVEERRDPEIDAPTPTCRQIVIGEQGEPAVPALDNNGEPIVIEIAEMTLSTDEKAYYDRRSFGSYMWERGDGSNGDELSDCGCLWWLT